MINQRNQAHLFEQNLKTFITRHGYRITKSNRYYNDQRNQAHLVEQNLKTFITLHGYRIVKPNRYHNDQRNQTHLFEQKNQRTITTHTMQVELKAVSQLKASIKYKHLAPQG